jgi:hypothetical protein
MNAAPLNGSANTVESHVVLQRIIVALASSNNLAWYFQYISETIYMSIHLLWRKAVEVQIVNAELDFVILSHVSKRSLRFERGDMVHHE